MSACRQRSYAQRRTAPTGTQGAAEGVGRFRGTDRRGCQRPADLLRRGRRAWVAGNRRVPGPGPAAAARSRLPRPRGLGASPAGGPRRASAQRAVAPTRLGDRRSLGSGSGSGSGGRRAPTRALRWTGPGSCVRRRPPRGTGARRGVRAAEHGGRCRDPRADPVVRTCRIASERAADGRTSDGRGACEAAAGPPLLVPGLRGREHRPGSVRRRGRRQPRSRPDRPRCHADCRGGPAAARRRASGALDAAAAVRRGARPGPLGGRRASRARRRAARPRARRRAARLTKSPSTDAGPPGDGSRPSSWVQRTMRKLRRTLALSCPAPLRLWMVMR